MQEKHLQNEKIAEVPNWHESLFTELSNFLFVKLNTSIKCISDAFHNFSLQIFPEIWIRSMNIQFAAPI